MLETANIFISTVAVFLELAVHSSYLKPVNQVCSVCFFLFFA